MLADGITSHTVSRRGMAVLEPPKSMHDNRLDCRIRLMLADDGERTRRALRALFATCSDLEVVGEAADGSAAIQLVARERPDIVVMDLRMPIVDGLKATGRIKQRCPRVQVVILSVDADARDRALAAGADAFVAKGDPEDALLETIRALARTARG
jgi:DNA-binding NarL/FixJ family response regulator